MKKLLPTLLLLIIHLSNLKAQYVTIPDANFRAVLKSKYPSCFNASDMMDTTCSGVVNETTLNVVLGNITNLTGVQYFDKLNSLDCSRNQLSSLPVLPISLKYLNCQYNQLISLPPLPSLIQLNCFDNLLTNLPSLPPSLLYLSCVHNQISTLPSLPVHLISLYCWENQLTSIPSLPLSLTELNCNNNQITSLPSLPPTLVDLICNYNQITSLPPLPSTLVHLDCVSNQLSSLPSLPSKLYRLDCESNQLTCLPLLPNILHDLYITGNSIVCLPNIPTNLKSYDKVPTTCNPSNNSNNCTIYPLIKGNVFVDDNKNGIQDGGETGYPNSKLEIQPGNYILNSDMNGRYAINVDTGSYTLRVMGSNYPYYTIEPSTQTATFHGFGQIDSLNNFALQAIAVVNDLRITITSFGRVRQGRDIGYSITYQNIGTTTLSGNVSFDYDAKLIFNSTSMTLANHVANNLTWNYSNIKPGESKNISVYFTLPSTVAIGTDLNFTATINPVSGDNTPTNNVERFTQTVNGSYDPNFKEVLPEGDITPFQVASQEPFTYVVHFQNTGTDTAFVVSIKDTISTNFEILQIETIAASHNYSFKMKNGATEWKFDNILLVDSITNEPLSHGFVKYKVIPKNTLAIGDEIKNTAHIFFDYNAPVKTNTTLNKVSIPTSISQNEADAMLNLYPNPSKGSITLSYTAAELGSIKVLSTDGRIISSLPSVDFSKPVNIDLSVEQKGIYFVQAIIGDKMVMKKVVIQ